MAVTGDINVTIYGGNRTLWNGGKIDLLLLDPFSNTEKVIVRETTPAKTKTVLIKDVPIERGQKYSLIASAAGHRTAGIFPIKPRVQGVTHTAVMLIRKDPALDLSGFSFELIKENSPRFYEALTGISEQDFLAMEPERIAAALNIEAKLRNTPLEDTAGVEFLRKIDSLENILPDRFYAHVEKTMPEGVKKEIRKSDSFELLPEWANKLNHEGFPISFKQRIPLGSLQLSFAADPVDDLLAADIDIDLFYGISHFGEVLRNKLTENKTDPFTVYVQLFDQRIFPLYVLKA